MIQSRRVRILEISSYPPPHAGWGVRISFVRKHLEAAGHECKVLNIGKGRKVKSPEYLDVQNGLDYLRKVIRHAWSGYLVHAHINGDSPKGVILAVVAELVSMATGGRSVLTFHAGPEQRFFPKQRSYLMAPFFSLAFALPQKIICNSASVKQRILTYGIRSEKVMPIQAFSRQYIQYSPTVLPEGLENFMKGHKPVLATYFFLRPEFFVESLFESIRQLTSALPDMGLVLIGGDTRSEVVTRMIKHAGIKHKVFQAGDLTHDQFMTVLSKVHIYLRTPEKDGVCSSVLEALSLKVPVIASENGTRPPGVVTFTTNDAVDLFEKIQHVWGHYDSVRSGIILPPVENTVEKEAGLIVELALAFPLCDP